jgi:hypothetical protein
MNGIRKISIELFDLGGKIVYRSVAPYQNGGLNLGELAAGNYVLNIYSEDRKYRHTQKLVKQ